MYTLIKNFPGTKTEVICKDANFKEMGKQIKKIPNSQRGWYYWINGYRVDDRTASGFEETNLSWGTLWDL